MKRSHRLLANPSAYHLLRYSNSAGKRQLHLLKKSACAAALGRPYSAAESRCRRRLGESPEKEEDQASAGFRHSGSTRSRFTIVQKFAVDNLKSFVQNFHLFTGLNSVVLLPR